MSAHRLSEDCPGRELLELYEKLRETVVHALEVSATRVRLSSNMQAAQARLLAQGVSGVTTAGMINGAVELVSAHAGLKGLHVAYLRADDPTAGSAVCSTGRRTSLHDTYCYRCHDM